MVKRVHGNDGELLIRPLTDRPERFDAGATLNMSRKGSKDCLSVRIESSRPSDKGPIVKFVGFNSREEVWNLFGASLFVPLSELAEPGRDSYFSFQLEGLQVYEGGRLIGTVTALHESRKANPFLEIDPGNGEKPLYIPFLKAVITSIDLEAGRIEILPGFTGTGESQ